MLLGCRDWVEIKLGEMVRIGQIDFYRPPNEAELDLMHTRGSPGVASEVFEKCTVSWARNKYGGRFGKEWQRNEGRNR